MDSRNYIIHANDLKAGWQYSANIRIVKTKNDHGHSTSNLVIPVFGLPGTAEVFMKIQLAYTA